MKSLYDLMCEKLNTIDHDKKYTKLDDFITDDDKSQGFIDSLTIGASYASIKDRKVYGVSETRARHSAITFLLGLVFWDFGDLENKIEQLFTSAKANNAYRVWLMTALNHDMAYSSVYLERETVNYNDITNYYLFDDSTLSEFTGYERAHSDILRYYYREILQYDTWARGYHTGEGHSEERVDHGILGGVLTFDRMMRRTVNDGSGQGYIIKPASLTIAQHNMFKSSSPADDLKYPGKPSTLQFGSSTVVGFHTPLLLLLSIVDTVECVKKFCRRNLDAKTQIVTLNVLKGISCEVSPKKITIDYTGLMDEITSKGIKSVFDSYYGSVSSLRTWTALTTAPAGANAISIFI